MFTLVVSYFFKEFMLINYISSKKVVFPILLICYLLFYKSDVSNNSKKFEKKSQCQSANIILMRKNVNIS